MAGHRGGDEKMPRTYKKNKRRGETSDDLSKLTGMRDYYLRVGLCLSGCELELGFSPDDLMSARRLWILHKAELMTRQDLKNPGYRPWA